MTKIEFRRTSENVVYRFSPDGQYNGRPAWRREDKNITIVFIDHIGWCVLDEDLNQVGWPFADIQNVRAELPPEGKWISWKKGESYVYDLIVSND